MLIVPDKNYISVMPRSIDENKPLFTIGAVADILNIKPRMLRLYEEKGLKDKAMERYEKFLDIWKDADDDLPEKQDAMLRLARLRG